MKMKATCMSNLRKRGSVLVISLVTVAILSFTLASYLALLSHENYSVMRSKAWNTAVPVMEAGVEEALTQIHFNGYTNLAVNGWSMGADGCYHKTRDVGTNGSYCQIAIQPVDPPVIYSKAYVRAPLSDTTYVAREVKVTTELPSAGGGGLTAKGQITLSGGATFDSFDSAVGPYNPADHGTNAIALSNTNVAGAVYLSGGAIYGMAVTGPGGTIKTSGSAAVGDPTWIAAGNTGVETGYSANDANFQFNDVTAPSLGSAFGSFTTVGNTNFAGFTGMTTSYQVGNISIPAGKCLVINGDVTIYCTDQGNNVVNVSGSGFIQLMPGARLTLYSAGNITVSGGGIVNETGLAKNLSIYGLPTCTQVTYSGGAAFVGTVYAPEAAFTFSGGAGAYGAFTADSVVISGSGGVHYDQDLGRTGGYVMASWNEITPN